MDKNTYFLNALKADCHMLRAWVISAFSLVQENPEEYKKDPYPYRLVQTATGFFYVDPQSKELKQIENSVKGEPLFDFADRIQIKKGEIPNADRDLDTTIGNLLVNYILLIYPFNDHYPFITGPISVSKIEDWIARDLDRTITVEQYLKFTDAAFYLTNFTQISVWAATPKTVVPPPGIQEFRDKLLEEYKDRLHDPVVAAEIDKQLVEYYKEYIKGDPGVNFLMSKKSIDTVARKLFLMQGVDARLDDGPHVNPVTRSLVEGWDVSKFPDMMDGLRAGSYSRGAQTALGGEQVKWLMRTSSNMRITQKDCGSTLGDIFLVTPNNVQSLVGFSIIENGKTVEINDMEQANKYLGKKVEKRTPMYCKLDKTDYCEICCGKNLSANPKALSMAVSEYGSIFMNLMMKKMHVSGLSVEKADLKEIIF